ncbi:CDP-glucose 4,6-dehydratase [Pectinatus haikarae]|uniref:CDP-glucose 4,6-dehydratase n=1 Tax=Pectinatus haikarae TaxID=349096 RepID=UPI0018C7ADF6|nr:CDP-glucose 4,6-dehydratase [Pectinatus haikarae]
MNLSFWKNKKVFVTGHTGFKGSWLSLWLAKLGAEVTGYALKPPTNPSLFDVAAIKELIISMEGDIRNYENLKNTMQQVQPEIVIHMAAQPLVRKSYKYPILTYETNVMGTVNLLEAVRTIGNIKSVVNVTTDKCYENREWIWGYRENEPMGGYDPYSNSKGCSELVTAAYRNSFFSSKTYEKHKTAIATARAGNVIGGGDWAEDRLIPDCLKSLLNGEPVNIRSPYAIRPWQHVLEPLSGYLTLAEKLYNEGSEYAEGWNFGPDGKDIRNVEWIVKYICSQLKNGSSYRIENKIHLHENKYLNLDCTKAKFKLHWQPKWHLQEALDKTIEWAKAYEKNADMREVCLKQICEYEK